jgi:hypothetical protein
MELLPGVGLSLHFVPLLHLLIKICKHIFIALRYTNQRLSRRRRESQVQILPINRNQIKIPIK